MVNTERKEKRKEVVPKISWFAGFVFIAMNVMACFHAWKFTHFADVGEKTKNPQFLSFSEKIKISLTGIANPRPRNKRAPSRNYENVWIRSNKLLHCWNIRSDNSKGTVILFHGYGGDKSAMLNKANEFLALGYSTFLVDFMGSGGSEGNQTTLGFKEAEEVLDCYDYIRKSGESNIYLFGTSMGAAAIMKALCDYHIRPSAIIVECPFGTMYETVRARFRNMGVPSFPMASLFIFWGGLENGFWAFSHNPSSYAKKIDCPVLLLYGERDLNVSASEIGEIFRGFRGRKKLKVFPNAGHEDYLLHHKDDWVKEVKDFMNLTEKRKVPGYINIQLNS